MSSFGVALDSRPDPGSLMLTDRFAGEECREGIFVGDGVLLPPTGDFVDLCTA